MQGRIATIRHGVTRERERKDEKDIGKLLRKSPKEKGVY